MPSRSTDRLGPLLRFALPLALVALLLGACAKPNIKTVAPGSVRPGGLITITGSGFGEEPTVKIDGIVAHIKSRSDAAIIVEVPVDAQEGDIVVINNPGTLEMEGHVTISTEEPPLPQDDERSGEASGGTLDPGTLFPDPLLGWTIGSGVEVPIGKLDLDKDTRKTLERNGALSAYEAEYSSKGVDAGVLVIQFGDEKAAAAAVKALEKSSASTYVAVNDAKGTLSTGTEYSGYWVNSFPDDRAVFLIANQNDLLIRVTLFGPVKSSDEKAAHEMLGAVAEAAQ